MFNFSNYSTGSKYYDDSNKLVDGKMKYETTGVAIKEFVRLKPKMYSFLVDDNSKHKKAKGVKKNIVAIISHNEYKDVLLNKKCLRYSMNRIQSKDNRAETYEINHDLIRKYPSKTMDMMDKLLVIRVNYIKNNNNYITKIK